MPVSLLSCRWKTLTNRPAAGWMCSLISRLTARQQSSDGNFCGKAGSFFAAVRRMNGSNMTLVAKNEVTTDTEGIQVGILLAHEAIRAIFRWQIFRFGLGFFCKWRYIWKCHVKHGGLFISASMCSWHIEAETKRPPFCTWCFQMHLIASKLLCFYSHFSGYLLTIRQHSGNGFR